MPVDKEEIRKALDHFENDEYTEAQEILQKEINKQKMEWLSDKLDLKGETEADDSDDEETDDDASDDDTEE